VATGVRIDRADLVTVSLSGPLTLDRTTDLRGVLLRCLAECPSAVVIDLTGATADSDLPLTVFPAVARHASRWPGAPVLLAVPPGPLADRLAHRRRKRYLPVFSSREAAVASLADAGEPAAPALRTGLPFALDALPTARRLVAQACQGWGLSHLAGYAELIASELAGNAVQHAAPPLRLVAAARGAYLHIVVRDGTPLLPSLLPPAARDALSVVDHGLSLVNAVATAWGCLRTAGGKAVWATLRTVPIGSPPLVRPRGRLRGLARLRPLPAT
jgi:hypothetical protein